MTTRHSIHLLLLGLPLLAACGPHSGSSADDGILTLRTATNLVADLGRIEEKDGPVTFRLVAVNDLSDTLFPVSVYTPCGCTEVHFEKRPIAPGEDEVLELSYNPAYRPGPMMEQIQVYYRHSPVRVRSFAFKGEVIGYRHPIEEDRPYVYGEGLYMSHKILNFGHRRPGEDAEMFFRHGNGNDAPADIRFAIPEPWQNQIRLRQPGRMDADERDTLHVHFTMPAGVDSVDVSIQPLVNGKATAEKLRIQARKKK